MKLVELHEQYKQEDVAAVNKTFRSTPAIGEKAVVVRYIEKTAHPDETILDFGAGKVASHTTRLRKKGLKVTAHDFGANISDTHDLDALSRTYDTVFASNVLNVQLSLEMLHRTLTEIESVVANGGRFVANYPQSPRKGVMAEINAADLETILMQYFSSVRRVSGTKRAPVWEARK